jgi:hypothetical protein
MDGCARGVHRRLIHEMQFRQRVNYRLSGGGSQIPKELVLGRSKIIRDPAAAAALLALTAAANGALAAEELVAADAS